jgi:hypothetical protein
MNNGSPSAVKENTGMAATAGRLPPGWIALRQTDPVYSPRLRA